MCSAAREMAHAGICQDSDRAATARLRSGHQRAQQGLHRAQLEAEEGKEVPGDTWGCPSTSWSPSPASRVCSLPAGQLLQRRIHG